MKPYAILRTLFLHALITPVPGASSAIQALYLFKDVFQSNTTALTTSGFNTLIIFGVGILSNGDIMYYSNTPGPGPTTPLYRNLAALDAVNQDDESIYHADSTVAFARMLGAVGLRYSIAPYDGRVVSFWAAVRSRVGWGRCWTGCICSVMTPGPGMSRRRGRASSGRRWCRCCGW